MSKTNLEIVKGEAINYDLTFTSEDSPPIVDITGWKIAMTIKANDTDPDARAKLQKIVTDFESPELGLATIALTADDTDINAGYYFYDMRAKKLDSNYLTIQYGHIRVIENITKAIA